MPNVLISELGASPALVGTDVIMVQHAAGPPAEQSTIAAVGTYVTQTALATGIVLASGAHIQSAGNYVLGAGTALATTATVGYVMIGSCAGQPSGVPVGFGAGNMPIQYDTTNNKLWVYAASGAWRGVALT